MLFGIVRATVALLVAVACTCWVPQQTLAILGNAVFDSVQELSNTFSQRHDELFYRFQACIDNFTKQQEEASGRPATALPVPSKLYVTQDGTGGGGVGNLILKINTVVSYAISNGLEYIFPPLLPLGHDQSQLYLDFFDRNVHDVAMRAASVLQVHCPRKYKGLERMKTIFPNNTQPWWEIGGAEDFQKAKWGGPDNKRCYPTEVMVNCDEFRPPHKHLGNIGPAAVAAYSKALVLRFPGSMHYHHNFSLSAPLFQRAYAQRQARLFQVAWKPLILEHMKARDRAECRLMSGNLFAVIGIHIRLGDVAERFDEMRRGKRAAAKPHGNWGGKFNSPQMHLAGLDLVWNFIKPNCTKVIIVTDGDHESPEVKYFFEHAKELPGWNELVHRDECIYNVSTHVPAFCDVLFFSKKSVSSLDALNLLAYSDVIVASGSQFSRVAALVGDSILLNPNYGFAPRTHVIIPQRPSQGQKLSAKPQKLRSNAMRRLNHLLRQRMHRMQSAPIANSKDTAMIRQKNTNEMKAIEEEKKMKLALKAKKIIAENDAILHKIQKKREQVKEKKKRAAVQNGEWAAIDH